MSGKNYIVVCMMALLLVFVSRVQAQEPAAIPVGIFDVTPTLDISLANDSNIFNQTEGSEVSSTFTQVMPRLLAVASNGVVSYSLDYQIEDGSYSDTNDSDYTDYKLDTEFAWAADVRHLIELRGSISDGHDGRDPGSVTGLNVADLNEFRERELSARYTFGANGARGRIIFGVEKSTVDYTTNRSRTDILDTEGLVTDLSLLIGLGGVSRAVFQVIDTKADFPNSPDRDRESQSYLVGLEWELTGKAQGGIRVGRTNNDLVNDSSNNDLESTTWRVDLQWTPMEHSEFTLTSSQGVENSSNNVGSFINRTLTNISWRNKWSSQWQTTIGWEVSDADFEGDSRQDDTNTVLLGVSYQLKRWMSIGLGLELEERDSSDNLLSYEREIATLSLKMSL